MDELRIVLNADEQLRVDMQDSTPLSLRLQNAEIPVVTNDYEQLDNKPQINNVELQGNKTSSDLGLQDALTFDTTPTDGSSNPVTSGGIYSALTYKVDKAGDEMSGNLKFKSGSKVGVRVPTIDISTAPSSAVNQDVIFAEDLNGSIIAFMRAKQTSDGTTGVEFNARRTVGNTTYFNGVTFSIGSAGTQVVSVSTPAGWRSAIAAVNLAGDTMTGNLTAPNYIVKGSGSGVVPAIMGLNNNGSSLGTIDFFTTGQIQFRSYVVGVGSENYKLPAPTSAGTEYSILTSKFTGNEVSTAGTSVTVPNNTVTNIATITLPAGTWIVQFMAIFTSNSTGYRQIGLGANAVESHMTRYCKVIVGAASGADTQISSTTILAPSAQTTYYLNVVQTSGGNLSVIGGLDARRLV